eukprot:3184102-Alexandrium_andersonii.AAC.1
MSSFAVDPFGTYNVHALLRFGMTPNQVGQVRMLRVPKLLVPASRQGTDIVRGERTHEEWLPDAKQQLEHHFALANAKL